MVTIGGVDGGLQLQLTLHGRLRHRQVLGLSGVQAMAGRSCCYTFNRAMANRALTTCGATDRGLSPATSVSYLYMLLMCSRFDTAELSERVSMLRLASTCSWLNRALLLMVPIASASLWVRYVILARACVLSAHAYVCFSNDGTALLQTGFLNETELLAEYMHLSSRTVLYCFLEPLFADADV